MRTARARLSSLARSRGTWASLCTLVAAGLLGAWFLVAPGTAEGSDRSPAKAVVSSVATSPHTLPAAGGMVTVTARVAHATSCQLELLSRQGFPVVLLSPSPLPMRAGSGGLEAADEALAVRVERLERRLRLADLWVHGPVVDWDDYWTLEPLARVLRRPAYRRVS